MQNDDMTVNYWKKLSVPLIALALFVINWLCGMVIMALLVMERRNKPKWLWGASLGLVILFGLIAVGLVLTWILV